MSFPNPVISKPQPSVTMGETLPPLITESTAGSKRPCIRIKARIKIQGEHQPLNPAIEAKRPYQAYCETVTSSRSPTPEVFSTPPTHSEPFQSVEVYKTPTYTARITSRKPTASVTSTSSYRAAHVLQVTAPDTSRLTDSVSSKHDTTIRRISSQEGTNVQQTAAPGLRHLRGIPEPTSRNHTPSLSHVQQSDRFLQAAAQSATPRTSMRQKRYGRTEYNPLPPLPPSPPDTPVNDEKTQAVVQKAVNFSRGEVRTESPQIQKQRKMSHRTCGAVFVSPPRLDTTNHHDATVLERPQSKASRRTVTFADDTTISSRSSSPVHSHAQDRTLRQSRSFSGETQIPSSLRLYRSHDSLLAAKSFSSNDVTAHASRRTTPKDFRHRYHFGQRPPSHLHAPPPLGRSTNLAYNPRLSTSKAQYRGLGTLPRPLPSSLRVAQPQVGPRCPPWGSLANLDSQREIRLDARERDQARQFRAATLSEATTLTSSTGGVDGYGKEKVKVKKEVDEFREQVTSVYPDMAFDGNAGKGGRSCCCVVM